jgi:hypothetical protein
MLWYSMLVMLYCSGKYYFMLYALVQCVVVLYCSGTLLCHAVCSGTVCCCTVLFWYSILACCMLWYSMLSFFTALVQCVVLLYALVQCVVLLYCSGTVSSLLPKYSLHLPGNTLIKQAALPAHYRALLHGAPAVSFHWRGRLEPKTIQLVAKGELGSLLLLLITVCVV